MDLNDGEITDDLIQTLAAIDDEFNEKVESCCRMVRELESRAEMAAAESARLKGKAYTAKAKAKRLKEYVKENMVRMGTKTIEEGCFRITVASNPVSVTVLDETLIPSKYYVTVAPSLSKSAIKDALESGAEVPGVELVKNTSLRIS